MAATEETKSVTIKIDEATHARFKAAIAMRRQTMSEVIGECINNYIEQSGEEPKQETRSE